MTDPKPLVVSRQTVRAAVQAAAVVLAEHGIEEPFREAELLLAHALGCERAALLAHPERRPSPQAQRRYRSLIRQRAARVPLAYLTGRVGFRNLDLLVDRRVLIPRPETELVVEAALAYLAPAPSGRPLRVADIGTGSGAIALAIAQELPRAQVYATDISAGALAVARRNALRCGLAARVTFRRGNLCEPLLAGADALGEFDAMVSNPPYIAAGERAGLAPEVRDHEPGVALWASHDGLGFYGPLAGGAARLLRLGGVLVLEVPFGRAAAVARTVASAGVFALLEVRRDHNEIERVLVARKVAPCSSSS